MNAAVGRHVSRSSAAVHHHRQYSVDNFFDGPSKWLQQSSSSSLSQDFGVRNAAARGGGGRERSPAEASAVWSRSSSMRRYGDDPLLLSELSTGLLDLHSFDTELLPEMPLTSLYNGNQHQHPGRGKSFDDSEPFLATNKLTSKARVIQENNLFKSFSADKERANNVAKIKVVGAWQPSLNISTVLTSIGLLLSEPNPDDGLMCEASRECKYNRQAFDQKARSMTEKYAHCGTSGDTGISGHTQSNSKPSMIEVKEIEIESKPEANEYIVNCKKICGATSKKLTLESRQERACNREENEASNSQLFVKDLNSQMEVEGTGKELKHRLQNANWSREKLYENKRKLLLESSSQSRKRNENEEENLASLGSLKRQDSDYLRKDLHLSEENTSAEGNGNMKSKKLCQIFQNQPLGSLEVIDVIEEKMTSETNASAIPALKYFKPKPQKDFMDGIEDASSGTSHKKLALVGKKLSLGLRGSMGTQNKENVEPVQKGPSSYMSLPDENGGGNVAQMQVDHDSHIRKRAHSHSLSSPSKSITKQQDSVCDMKQYTNQGQNERICGRIRQEKVEEVPIPEAVIVLDSEDSEEDEKSLSLRSKPLLTRKRLGKWKLKA